MDFGVVNAWMMKEWRMIPVIITIKSTKYTHKIVGVGGEKEESIVKRAVLNSEEICQFICDLKGYFLPRNDSVQVTVRYKQLDATWDMHVMEIKDSDAVCELLEIMWKEWRFEDYDYEK